MPTVAERIKNRQAYAKRFVESIAGGLVVEDVVLALADACKRAIEAEVPANSPGQKRAVRHLATCAEALGEAAKKIRAAS